MECHACCKHRTTFCGSWGTLISSSWTRSLSFYLDPDNKPNRLNWLIFLLKCDRAKVAAYVPPLGRIRSSCSSTNIRNFDCLNFCLDCPFGFSIYLFIFLYSFCFFFCPFFFCIFFFCFFCFCFCFCFSFGLHRNVEKDVALGGSLMQSTVWQHQN